MLPGIHTQAHNAHTVPAQGRVCMYPVPSRWRRQDSVDGGILSNGGIIAYTLTSTPRWRHRSFLGGHGWGRNFRMTCDSRLPALASVIRVPGVIAPDIPYILGHGVGHVLRSRAHLLRLHIARQPLGKRHNAVVLHLCATTVSHSARSRQGAPLAKSREWR